MGALFDAASTQRLLCTDTKLLSTGYPMTMAGWVYPTTTGTSRTFLNWADTGTTNHYFTLSQLATNQWACGAAAGGAVNNASGGTVTANQWYFVIGRYITSTNRRLSVLSRTGLASASTTTSRAPTSLDRLGIGGPSNALAGIYFTGVMAECWFANADVGVDAASNLTLDFVHQLAHCGPFSVPRIAQNIVEYRSLRKNLVTADQNMIDDYWSPDFQTWTAEGGPVLSFHPPLPYRYQNDNDFIRKIPVTA